jgi:hypothetical protein
VSLNLDDVLERLNALAPKERDEVESLAHGATAHMRWIPNPGPQTQAYDCPADQLLYGGEAGGGKTDLILGLASQEHKRSLLLRRVNKDVSWLVDRMAQIQETRQGYNGQDDRWTFPDGKVIDFSGCQHPGDEQRNKGRPKDFIGFDEASDFLESQVEFILGWLRTTEKGQRCRTVFATNPPTSVEGEWIVRWFAPWVDPSHPMYPYPTGKLLWTCRGFEDAWLWFETPRTLYVSGQDVRDATLEEIADLKNPNVRRTTSRTFIRSGLSDNPDLANTNYRSQLELMPEELRKRYLKGDFTAGANDDEFQVIPTEWIRLAQERWTEDGGERMETMGVDVAQGGNDNTVFAPRWKGKKTTYWVDRLKKWKGSETPDGASVAGRVLMHLKHAAQVNVDMGGGWGGSTYEKLEEAEFSVYGFVPSETAHGRTQDGRLGFRNKRAEATWRVRELLAPESQITVALPPDPQLRADLASYRWKLMSGGVIQIEMKEDIKKRIGRSPDDGDAVILSLATGDKRLQPRRNDPANFQMQTKTTPANRYATRHRR